MTDDDLAMSGEVALDKMRRLLVDLRQADDDEIDPADETAAIIEELLTTIGLGDVAKAWREWPRLSE